MKFTARIKSNLLYPTLKLLAFTCEQEGPIPFRLKLKGSFCLNVKRTTSVLDLSDYVLYML